MSDPPLLRWARWVVPDDERGDALLGDWAEAFAAWRRRRGWGEAVLLLALDLLRSLPGLAGAALVERGWARIVLRSLPAVLAGCGLFLAPAILAGPLGRSGLAIAAAAALLLAIAGGWLAAALAGAAPRVHGMAVGIGLAGAGTALVGAGVLRGPAWLLAPLLLGVLTGAAYGGERFRRGRSRAVHAATGAHPAG